MAKCKETEIVDPFKGKCTDIEQFCKTHKFNSTRGWRKECSKSILVGRTDDELIAVEIELHGDSVSFSGNTYDAKQIMTEDEGEERAREYLEDGESWRDAVAHGGVTQSLDDWVEDVLNIDGWMHVVGDVHEIKDGRYIQGSSGGQIDMHIKPENFEVATIPKGEIKDIWTAWERFHMKSQKELSKGDKALLKKVIGVFGKRKEFEIEDLAKFYDEDWELKEG
jgi:hypothetical protein